MDALRSTWKHLVYIGTGVCDIAVLGEHVENVTHRPAEGGKDQGNGSVSVDGWVSGQCDLESPNDRCYLIKLPRGRRRGTAQQLRSQPLFTAVSVRHARAWFSPFTTHASMAENPQVWEKEYIQTRNMQKN